MHPAPGAGKLVAGRYRLLTQLGRGAMGVVWHGRDELLDRDVAVKQIVLGPAASDDDARQSHQRTIREARTAARLSHPGVVTIYDVADQDGMPWIVMELVRARPLEQVIAEDGPLTPPLAAQLGLGLLDALACAHAAGVLHRDVKPSNVLITPEGKAVLTDFGIAAILGDPAMTREGLVAGTPGFSPPERVRGATATPASDLWSLGATLYAAVEGRGPFDRAGGPAAIVASIATEPAPRAPSAGPLASVIDALLQSDPAQRPDAAATRRMLVAAWSGARRASRLGAATAAGATATGGPAAGNRGPDATTATQVVTVEDPGEGHDRRLLAAKPAAGSARDVVPDLMATPVFAELSMPGPDRAGTASPGQPPDAAASSREAAVAAGPAKSARSWLSNVRGAGDLIRSRRALVLTAPLAATAIVAGIVFLAFPGFGDNLLKGQLWHPGSTGTGTVTRSVTGGQPGGAAPGRAHQAGTVPGPGHRAGTSPHAGPTDGTSTAPGRSGRPVPSGQPSPSGSGTPAATPSPSPSPTSPVTTGSRLPAGYTWQSVTASSAGTTAGWRLGAPAAWVLAAGVQSYISNPAGAARLGVGLAAFAVQAPVREARHLQKAAIANGTYHRYQLVSILPRRFHGWPAATWTFRYRPAGGPVFGMTEVLFTGTTPAGPQPYDISMTAPAAHAAYASHVLDVALRTFSPLP